MAAPKIIFLGTGFHWLHVQLVDSVGLDIERVKFRPAQRGQNIFGKALGAIRGILTLPQADAYICESSFYYPALHSILFFWKKKPLIININASCILYELAHHRLSFLYLWLLRLLLSRVDCSINIGKYGGEVLSGIGWTGKTIVAYPALSEENFNALGKCSIAPSSHNMATIVTNSPYLKGLDVTIAAFKIVKRRFPDATLNVIGEFEHDGKIDSMLSSDGSILCTGRVKTLCEGFGGCSVYVHPGRGDPFPVAVCEAMAAGLIPLVSDETGTKELAAKVDAGLITPIDALAISDAIIRIFSSPKQERQRLSAACRETAAFLADASVLQKFGRELRTYILEKTQR
jgi:glycosyltransferase involved in cell wall biosynthesis